MESKRRKGDNARSMSGGRLPSAILGGMDDAVVSIDMNGLITFLNPAAERLMESPAEDALGMPLQEKCHVAVDGTDRFDVFLEKAGKGDAGPGKWSGRLACTAAGRQSHVACSLSPLKEKKGTITGFVIVCRTHVSDATEAEFLRRERLLLRTVIDNLPHSIYVKDREFRKTIANPADLRNSGTRSEAEVIGKTDFELFPNDIAEKFHADDLRVIRDGEQVLNREEIILDSNGKKRWLLTSKIPLRDAAGEVTGLVGIGTDITDRKAAEEALRTSETNFRLMAEASPSAILIFSKKQVLYVNKEAGRLMGVTREELLASDLWTFVQPESREILRDVLAQTINGNGELYHCEIKVLTRDGLVQTVESSTGKIEFEGESAVIASAYDITARTRAEAGLKLFRSLIDRSTDAFAVLEAETGRFLDANERAWKGYGYSRDELLRMTVFDIDPSMGRDAYALLRDSLTQWKSAILESNLRQKDGTMVPVEMNIESVQLDKEYLVSVIRDIT